MPIFSSNLLKALFYVSLMGFWACDSAERAPSGKHPNPLELSAQDGLETYPVWDNECQKEATSLPSGLDGAFLTTWEFNGLRTRYFDLKESSFEARPLRAKFVSGFKFGGIFLRSCDASLSAAPTCQQKDGHPAGWRLVQDGFSLKVCAKKARPARDNAEYLALSAGLVIESVATRLSTIFGSQIILDPIEVQITPLFESRWMSGPNQNTPTSHQFFTDNLSYFPSTDSNRAFIALLPQGKTHHSESRINLWESPFIVTHEYAHYLEERLGLSRFTSKRSHFRAAVSEAFADTVAFATLGGSQTIAAIPCSGKDRAPDSLEFVTGIAKIITQDLMLRAADPDLRASASPSAVSSAEAPPCQGVSPQSVHGVGAILAHWLLDLTSVTPDYKKNPTATLMHTARDWVSIVDSDIGAGIVLPNHPSDWFKPEDLYREMKIILIALEGAITREFERQGRPIDSNIRNVLRQKMKFAFEPLSDREWFAENP